MQPRQADPKPRSWRGDRGPRGAGLALLLALSLAAGCSSHAHWAALRAEREAFASARQNETSQTGDRDLRGAIHVHSHLSPDSEGSLAEILAAAVRADLDFVALTEHEHPGALPTGRAGLHGDVLVIPGLEIIKGCRGLADRCATLLALGVDQYFDPDPLSFQEVVDEVRRQGGLAVVAHPRGWRDWEVQGLHGLEIYDVLDDALGELWLAPKLLLDVLHSWDDWPEEVWLQIQDRPDGHLRRWDDFSQQGRLVGLAGNDAHQNVRVLGRQLDPYALSFGYVTTHVWAEAAERDAILGALAAGRAYVAFDLLADATGFRFGSEGAGPVLRSGDERQLAPGQELMLAVRAPLPGRIRLLRNGEPVGECRCRALSQLVDQPGVYRAEVELHFDGAWRPWIFSNPIYLR